MRRAARRMIQTVAAVFIAGSLTFFSLGQLYEVKQLVSTSCLLFLTLCSEYTLIEWVIMLFCIRSYVNRTVTYIRLLLSWPPSQASTQILLCLLLGRAWELGYCLPTFTLLLTMLQLSRYTLCNEYTLI